MKETGRNGLQSVVVKRLEKEFPGCIVLFNDPQTRPGIPDLVMFYQDRYFMLETKRSTNAKRQPNQDYYIGVFDDWGFARFVSPENLEGVIDEIQQSLRPGGSTRVSGGV